jgi:hypothetical protein
LDRDGGMNRELYANWHKKILNWRTMKKTFGIKIKNVSQTVTFVEEAKKMYRKDVEMRGNGYLEGDDEEAFDDSHLPEVDVLVGEN